MRAFLLAACLVASSSSLAFADALEIVADPAAASGEVTDIDIKDMAYGTPIVTVKPGATVRWNNKDQVAHNVQFRGGPAKGWDKAQGPMLNPGQSYAIKFNDAGEYKYICTPHSMVMKGVITVQ